MSFKKIAIITVGLILMLIQISFSQTVNIEINVDVAGRNLNSVMWQKDYSYPQFPGDTVAFNKVDTLRIVGALGGDSSIAFNSWDFTGIHFEVFSDTSVQFNIIIYTGKAFSTTSRMFTPFDTLAVDTTGVFKWPHNLPISEHFMYAVEGAAGNHSTTRMYAEVNRTRYEEEVPDPLEKLIETESELSLYEYPFILDNAYNYLRRNRLWKDEKDLSPN